LKTLELRAEEITSVIQKELGDFEDKLKMDSVGTVLQVGDCVARIYGLDKCKSSELLEFEGGVNGIALNLEEGCVGAVLLGDSREVSEGQTVKSTGRIISVPVGDGLLGRVVNALGEPLDGKGPIESDKMRNIECDAPNVIGRQPVKEPLQTGIKAVDSMIPIGRGQRELIIGDRQTGKTAICLDTIINQREAFEAGEPVYCIYVAIGQKQSTVLRVVETLEKYGAMDYTIVVTAGASDPAPMQYIAPFAGTAMGEEFRDTKRHALVIYDDLWKHAVAYRQVSLLLRRPPGREAFPGDIFNLHSRLLERSAKLSDENGAGSLTALPIVETQAGDFSAYIPTNVISITDGQIYLESDLFYAGVRPAINAGLSVSRVGGNAQNKAMKKVAGSLRLDLAQYRELEAFTKFGSELDKSTQSQLNRGERLIEVLKQPQYSPLSAADQVIMINVAGQGMIDDVPVDRVQEFEKGFSAFLAQQHSDIRQTLIETGELTSDLAARIKDVCAEYKKTFLAVEDA